MRYDGGDFLEGLFQPTAGANAEDGRPAPETTPANLPPEWHLAWDERAAIMEYGGGLPRERAEALALTEIIAQMRQRDLS